jgi:hypothetical protein
MRSLECLFGVSGLKLMREMDFFRLIDVWPDFQGIVYGRKVN